MSVELEVTREDLMNEPEKMTRAPGRYFHVFSAYASKPIGVLKSGDKFLYEGRLFKIDGMELKNSSTTEFRRFFCTPVSPAVDPVDG